MKKIILIVILLCTFLSGTALAYDSVPNEVLYVVNNPDPATRLNLRTEPNENARSLGRYYNGVRLEALSKPKNGWIYVAVEGSNRNVKGYMQTQFLVYNPSTPVPSAIPSVWIRNKNGKGLNLRLQPSTTANIQVFVNNGTQAAVLGWGEQWCHVQIENLTGYMQTSGLDFGTTSSGTPANGTWLNIYNPIASDRLHLRTAPRANATSLGKYYNGVSVEVLSYPSNDWAKVQIGSTVGYMQRKYLTTAAVSSAIPKLIVNNPNPKDRLNLRSGMSEKSDSLGRYYNGTVVEVLGIGTTWYHVRVDGKLGYMLAKYLAEEN